MAEEGVGTLFVLDPEMRPRGVLTDRDIAVRCVAQGRDPVHTAVAAVMSKPVVSVSESTPIEDALAKMAAHEIRSARARRRPRAPGRRDGDDRARAAEEVMKLEKILVPVDFSEPSRAALHLALQIAEAFRAKVEVLHVLELSLYSKRELTRATEEMDRLLSEQRRTDLAHAIVTGEPSSKILEAGEQGAYDLIVLGTHGRGLKHLLLGSTAEWIVRHADCPVLTTRADPKGLHRAA
jgi:nucleotide-binding universal stress UspA family protein